MKFINSFYCILLFAFGLTFAPLEAIAQADYYPLPSNCVASPEPVVINQPDGTSITVIGKGNMNNSWAETTDGYTVIKNSAGVYEYANKVNGDIVPSGIKANNPNLRLVPESTYLTGVSKSIKPKLNPLKASILNQVNAHLQHKTYPTSGNIRVLALLIDYPDLVNVIPKSDFDSLLYGANYRSGDGSFKAFYETSSGNQLTVTVDVQGWYRATNNFQYYARDSGYDRAADLVREAVDAAEIAGTNFSLYDNDTDGDVDGILVIHSGPGAEIGSQGGLYIWSHRWVLNGGNLGSAFYDGVSINDYMINPEVRSASNQSISGIGVFCHEFGHNLGLPDLYDTDNSNGDSEGIGNWCLMAGGSYSGGSNRPSNFSAWCKEELGWDSPQMAVIGNSGIYTLSPSSTSRDEILRVNTNLSNEYFLIENRQRIGRDSDLPGHGLAIWHINTTKTNSPGNSVNADENLKGVDLEEADGNNDLDNEVNRGDGGDLFPGTSNRITFDDNTNPSAQTYNLTNTGLQIRNISEVIGGNITFDFGQVPGAPCLASTTLTSATGSFDDGSGAGLNYANNQSCSWLIQPTVAGTVTLSFSSFDTELINDTVNVYDGTTASATLLGSYSGSSIPSSITSSGSAMFVTFNSNATINGPGFDASYITNIPATPCSGTTTLTTASGSFDDGSGVGNYQNNQNCSWLIQPVGAASITFGLSSLATEIGGDIITVYDGPSAASPILGSYSGTNNLNTLTSSTGSIFVTFISNGSITDQGFNAFYTSTTSSAGCSGATTFTANSGTFSDGSMTNNYNNNQFCSWLIQPSAGGTITLSFTAFSTESVNDRVIVFDGIDNTAPQIGNFSGSAIPASLTSSSSALYLEFRTNGTVTDQGWDASYITNIPSTPTCSGNSTLNATAGTFTDGSGPNINYSNNLNCTWLISPSGINNIRLTVDSLDLASNDSIIIFDGASNSAPVAAVYKGNTLPPFLTSSGPNLFIEFYTDGSNVDKGWQMSYQSFNGCAGRQTLTAAAGTFNDGTNANQNYVNNLSCEWLIQPPGATFIELSFNRFATENCCDAVTVYDGPTTSSPVLGSFRGNTIPSNLTSSGGSMLVRFTTDISVVNSGWEASYTSTTAFCLPNRNLTAATGSLSDGSGTSNYDNNSNCSWLIAPPFSSSITLTFTNFDTETSNDIVSIYDGIDNTGTLMATYSGSSLPAAVTVNGSTMYVEFTTNGNTTAAGWDATYTSVGGTSCSGTTTLTAANGTFDDGSGLSNYSRNLNCGWLIQPASAALITLNMTSMNLANFGDRVRVYDGVNNSGTLIASYFGTNTTTVANAFSGSMFVEFVTDNFNESQGWTAVYNSSTSYCLPNTTLTANFGNFTDGSPFGQNYLDNTDCSWLIQPTTPNIVINLNLFQVDTELGNDTITVYDGATTAAPILNTFSGLIPFGIPVITSTGGEMLVTFKSNGNTTANGWIANYSTQAAPACSGTTTLTAASGTFDDGTPALTNYVENSNCSWLIQPTGATAVSLSFNRFDTQTSQDIVTIYDGSDNTFPVIGTFSGQTIPNTILSTGNALFVEFTSDGFFNLTGWEISYVSTNNQCFSNLLLNSYRDTIEDGSGANNYSNNLNCSWLIQPNTATSVTLTFLNFDVDSPGDTLKIYDGVSSSSTLLAALTGTTLPTAITSTGGSMYLEFITDGSSTAAGWRAFYDITSSLSCIGTTILTGSMGSFDDGSGTGNYDNNLGCSWLIQPSNNPTLITLTMNTLNLANFGDVVNVYDGTNNTAPLIASFFGTFTGNPVDAFSGSMFVEFSTDNFGVSSGWTASYATSSSYCQANTVFTGNFGNFEDGSTFTRNYLDNTSCEWLIQPAAPNVAVRLTFTSFDTEAINDTVTVYNGATTADPILGTFSGNTIPPVLTSSGGDMLVSFKSNGSTTASGWDAFYQTQRIPACAGQTSLTAATGTFNDGSAATSAYVENSNCSWLIQPPGALNIDLTFSRFNTEANFDFVTVYDGPDNTSPMLGSFSGATIPAVINGSKSAMFVEFTTNGNTNLTGWEASYVSINTVIVDASVDTIYVNAGAGSTASLNLTSNVSWNTTDNAAWLVATPGNGIGNATINALAIQANIGPERAAQLIIKSTTTADADTVVVIQRTSGRFIIANPDTLFYIANAAPGQIASLNTNVNWTLTPNQTWISTSPSSGSNNGSSNITVQNNTSSTQRIGYVVVSGTSGAMNDTIFVVQEAAPLAPPSLSVNPMSITLAQPMNSTDMFTVNSTTSWQTQSSASWLSVTNPTNTFDTNVVQVTAISMNLNPLPRAAYVAVQDVAGTLFDTVFVFQAGLTPILIGNPDTILLGANSGSTGILNIGSTGNWSGVEGDVWFDLGQTSGSGISMVNLTTNSANTSTAQKFSFVALADVANNLTDTVIVIQDTAVIGLVTTPDTIRLSASAGSSNTFDVRTNLGWAAITPATWLTVNPNAGMGSGTVTVTASANPMMTDRIDFIEVASTGGAINVDTVWVIQDGLVANLNVSPNVLNLNFTSGSNDVITLTSNTSWTVTNPASWLSVTPPAGVNNATLTATATSDNLTGATRSATITVDGVGAISKTITINQIDGSTPTFVSSKDTVFVDNPQGSTGNFSILSNVNSWTLSENTSWLLVNPISGSQTETITVLVATRNIFGTPRYATITASASGFPDRTIVVAQKEATPFFQVAPDSIIVGADSASFTEFNISSNMPVWTVTEGAAWLEISPDNGSFTQRVRATAVERNSTSAQRFVTATIAAAPLVPLSIKIIQDTIRTIGINEKSFEGAFKLYPNPSSGEVIIKIGDEFVGNAIEANLYNLLGEEVPVQVDFSTASTVTINLNEQSNGIYFLRIRYRGETFSKKLSLIK